MINFMVGNEIDTVINNPNKNRGLYVCFTDGAILAVDNSTHNLWMEEFQSIDEAIAWVRDEDAPDKKVIYKVKFAQTVSTHFYTKEAALTLAEHLSDITGCDTELLEVIRTWNN